MDEGISYVFVWHCLSDACPKCQSLNGHEWHDQDIFQETLWDAIWGNLWDFNSDHTLSHPNCRCQLEVRTIIDWNKFVEIKELQSLLNVNELPKEEVRSLPELQEMRTAVQSLKSEISSLKMDYSELREMETLLNRTLITLERATGSKEISQAISSIQRVITMIRLLQATIQAFYAASGPIGWGLFAVGVVSTALTVGTLAADFGGR